MVLKILSAYGAGVVLKIRLSARGAGVVLNILSDWRVERARS